MHVYIYKYIHICIYTYICTYTYVYIYLYVHIYKYIYISTYAYISCWGYSSINTLKFKYIYIYVYTYIYVYEYINTCICIHMYIFIFAPLCTILRNTAPHCTTIHLHHTARSDHGNVRIQMAVSYLPARVLWIMHTCNTTHPYMSHSIKRSDDGNVAK